MNINVVRRPDEGRFAKVGAARKQWVEGLEVGIVRVVITARDVRFQSKPRLERSIFKCEPKIGRCGPRLDIARAKAAELIHKFQGVIPTGCVAPNPPPQRVPELM